MQKNKRIDWICLSGDDYWNSNPHSRYHIAKEFSKKGKVLWVNSIGHRFPTLKKKKGWLIIFRKLRSYFIFFRKPLCNFYVLSPITIPIFKGNFVKKLNSELLWIQIKIISKIIKIEMKYFFISSPMYGILHRKLKNMIVIYYYSDLYTSYRELINKNEIIELDNHLIRVSKLIYAASKKISDTLKTKGINVKYLPHAVDKEHFNIVPNFIPEEIKNIKHPIIGYYGSITDSNDWEIIEYCSRMRPNYSFVFIGKKLISLPELESRKNIHFIDKVPYDMIPYYGYYFDVAIMFWVMREWIIHSSPLKLLEYFALGKPVVSVDIPEVREKFSDLVFIAKTKFEFLEKIDLALQIDKVKMKEAYKKILTNNSWENLVNIIYKDLENEII